MNTNFFLNFAKWYNGKKLSIVTTGAGVSLAQLVSVPGASSFFHSFYMPYETQESIDFIKTYCSDEASRNFAEKAVSPMAAENLYFASRSKKGSNVSIFDVAITAAITSSRWRRGDNKAFIYFQGVEENECWHLKLPKLTEDEHRNMFFDGLFEQRSKEDFIIASTVIRLISGFESKLLEEAITNGSLTKVNA